MSVDYQFLYVKECEKKQKLYGKIADLVKENKRLEERVSWQENVVKELLERDVDLEQENKRTEK